MRRLKDAFGKTPASFDAFVEERLGALMAAEERPRPHLRPHLRPRPRAPLLAAVALVLILGAVIALFAGMGGLELVPVGTAAPLPSATPAAEHVQVVAGVQSSPVRLIVRDATLDADRLMLTLDIVPKRPDRHILLPFDASPLSTGLFEGTERTYLDMAEETGKILLEVTPPSISVGGGNGYGGNVSHMAAEDRLVYYAQTLGVSADKGDLLDIYVSLMAFEVRDAYHIYLDGGEKETHTLRGGGAPSSLRFSLTAQGGEAQYLYLEGPVASPPVTVDYVEVCLTSLATYLKVRYTVREGLTEAEREAVGHMTYYLLDGPQGTLLVEQGPAVTRFLSEPDADGPYDGAVLEEDTAWTPLEALPHAVYLRPYYRDTGTWGMTITLHATEWNVAP